MFLNTFRNIFKITELRKRILFTLGILALERIGTHIVTPGVNSAALQEAFASQGSNTLFGLFDLFAGGAFSKAAVFSLGIMPYISASIIIQLLGSVFPFFQKLQREGEEGRKKITQYTRYGTLFISAMQSYGVAIFLESFNSRGFNVIPDPGINFITMTMLSMSAGTMLIMWLGEQIDDRGIGNGISLIIFIGIISRIPYSLYQEFTMFNAGQRILLTEILLMAFGLGVIAVIVLLTQGTRKIPIQYAKRVVGRKVYGGVNTHFPLRVNTAGVMPIIFAQAIMFIPGTLSTFFTDSDFMGSIQRAFAPDSWIYAGVYAVLIIFFTYFYTAIALNPVDVADNLKRQGGFIPGVRPGKKTSEFLDNILTRITLPGSIFLAFIAILPTLLVKYTGIPWGYASLFGGTSLLIIVGVALDFLQQVESHLFMRHYDGFMKAGRIRGRR